MSKQTAPPLPQRSRRNLVQCVVEALRADIAGGAFRPGERLPSEVRLTERFGVSRTVVREAVAGLRADGLVEPRQGAGVFVLDPPEEALRPFQILDLDRISSIIEMLELRVAVEMEAAALAALRRSPLQEERVLEACDNVRRLAAEGRGTSEADLAFHLAIADATSNPRFREFLEILGVSAIPRSALRDGADGRSPEEDLARICAEHRKVAAAISHGDPQAARAAMREHLSGSQQRYRDLLQRRE